MFLVKTGYFSLIKFFILSVFFSFFLFFLCFLIIPKITVNGKLLLLKGKKSAYECGFEPFNDTRGFFEVHFCVTAIMFLLFDIEVAFLLPWVLNVEYFGVDGFYTGFFFFLLLLLGFFYELLIGALDWPVKHTS